MSKLVPAWSKTACNMCGNEFDYTRANPLPEAAARCEFCQGFAEGEASKTTQEQKMLELRSHLALLTYVAHFEECHHYAPKVARVRCCVPPEYLDSAKALGAAGLLNFSEEDGGAMLTDIGEQAISLSIAILKTFLSIS